MSDITANDLKTRGVSALEAALGKDDEAVISVRGKPRFVVMDIAHYEQLREAEIFAAWQEARAAETRGDTVIETAEEHIARYKVPRTVDFRPELPRLPTGKLYKRILRDEYWGNHDTRIV